MNIERVFKNTILLNAACVVVVATGFFSTEEVDVIYDNLSEGTLLSSDIGLVVIGILLVMLLASWVLLYRFISYGKPLYLWTLGMVLVLILLTGPIVLSPIDSLFDAVEGFTTGAIIVFLFFTSINLEATIVS